jgi:signal transduction histidine kinase
LILKEPFKVNCDRDKIHEVILNLLGNAVKFTPVGGKISLSYSKEGETVQINVKDNGPGISEEDKSKLFQKFSRLEHSYMKMAETTGTGLGLYISKQIVSLHGGRIWVDSKVGEGSTFSFTIPLQPFPQITNGHQYSVPKLF